MVRWLTNKERKGSERQRPWRNRGTTLTFDWKHWGKWQTRQSRLLTTRSKFEPGISRIQAHSATAAATRPFCHCKTVCSNIFATKMCKLFTCRPITTVYSCKWIYEGCNVLQHIIGLSCFWTGPSIHLPSVRGFSNTRPPATCLPTEPRTRINTVHKLPGWELSPLKSLQFVHTHLFVTQTTRLWQT